MFHHTPAPWHVVKYGICSDEAAPYGVQLIVDGAFKDVPATRANATLQAAAPQLLEALKETKEALKDIINAAHNGEAYNAEELAKEFIKICDTAEMTINKATGV